MNIENIQHPYGLLLNQEDLKLHRKWFDEMVRLIGVQVIYRGIREGKKWTTYAEIDSNYYEPICIGCIFNEYPDQKTMKKLGWVSQTDQQASIISVPFDTPHIQVGSLFIIPNALSLTWFGWVASKVRKRLDGVTLINALDNASERQKKLH